MECVSLGDIVSSPIKSFGYQVDYFCHDFLLLADFDDEASGATFFMIVNFPEDAAETICCSIDRLILAVKLLCIAACFTKAAFFGAMYFFPFFGAAAALAA